MPLQKQQGKIRLCHTGGGKSKFSLQSGVLVSILLNVHAPMKSEINRTTGSRVLLWLVSVMRHLHHMCCAPYTHSFLSFVRFSLFSALRIQQPKAGAKTCVGWQRAFKSSVKNICEKQAKRGNQRRQTVDLRIRLVFNQRCRAVRA